MPRYDYHCPANGRTLEVRHGMSESVSTWGELCERAGLSAGDTPPDAPLERRIGSAVPLTGARPGSREAPGPSCCGPSSCGCA